MRRKQFAVASCYSEMIGVKYLISLRAWTHVSNSEFRAPAGRSRNQSQITVGIAPTDETSAKNTANCKNACTATGVRFGFLRASISASLFKALEITAQTWRCVDADLRSSDIAATWGAAAFGAFRKRGTTRS